MLNSNNKIPSEYIGSGHYYIVFFLPEGGRSGIGGYYSPSKKFSVYFNGSGTDPVHELLHALGLPNTFDGHLQIL